MSFLNVLSYKNLQWILEDLHSSTLDFGLCRVLVDIGFWLTQGLHQVSVYDGFLVNARFWFMLGFYSCKVLVYA